MALEAADLPAALERQKAGLSEVFAVLTDADLADRTATLPWGEETPLVRAVLELAYGSLVAYRMQLFLQAKAAGNASLATPNCRAGVDMPDQCSAAQVLTHSALRAASVSGRLRGPPAAWSLRDPEAANGAASGRCLSSSSTKEVDSSSILATRRDASRRWLGTSAALH